MDKIFHGEDITSVIKEVWRRESPRLLRTSSRSPEHDFPENSMDDDEYDVIEDENAPVEDAMVENKAANVELDLEMVTGPLESKPDDIHDQFKESNEELGELEQYEISKPMTISIERNDQTIQLENEKNGSSSRYVPSSRKISRNSSIDPAEQSKFFISELRNGFRDISSEFAGIRTLLMDG